MNSRNARNFWKYLSKNNPVSGSFVFHYEKEYLMNFREKAIRMCRNGRLNEIMNYPVSECCVGAISVAFVAAPRPG